MQITMSTLKSHNHIVGDIERGIRLYNEFNKDIIFSNTESADEYTAVIPQKSGVSRRVTFKTTRDGQDIISNHCYCTRKYKNPPICRHIIAAVLKIQGDILETPLVIGKAAEVFTTVGEADTAKQVGSGSLPVYATPSMTALMEKAACDCISDGLEEGQTSVGVKITVEHIAASLIGANITACARIEGVFGRRVELGITAHENEKMIGLGTHTRIIVDTKRFMSNLSNLSRL